MLHRRALASAVWESHPNRYERFFNANHVSTIHSTIRLVNVFTPLHTESYAKTSGMGPGYIRDSLSRHNYHVDHRPFCTDGYAKTSNNFGPVHTDGNSCRHNYHDVLRHYAFCNYVHSSGMSEPAHTDGSFCRHNYHDLHQVDVL